MVKMLIHDQSLKAASNSKLSTSQMLITSLVQVILKDTMLWVSTGLTEFFMFLSTFILIIINIINE